MPAIAHTNLSFASRRELPGNCQGRRWNSLHHAGDSRGQRRGSCRFRFTAAVDALIAEGVTSIEVKSGYGLDLDNERKIAAGRACAGDTAPGHDRANVLRRSRRAPGGA